MPKRQFICALLLLFGFGCTRMSNDSSPTQSDHSLIVRTIQTPATGDSREPDVSATADGSILLSWVEKLDAKRHALRVSLLYKTEWTQPYTVAEGDNWFINWADFPSVIGLRSGFLAAHWLVKSGSATYAYDVNIAFSSDGGQTWTKPIVPHLDNTQTEHGFVSLIPLNDGRAGAVWLDGRNMKEMKDDHDDDKPLPVSMTLRYAAIDASGKISDEAQLDERVCECCQTSAALSSDGVVAVYRDRSQNEVRDIYSVSQKNGAWGVPQAVHADNWEINGCPVNGPSIATSGRNVAVGWFTGAGGQAQVKVAFSTDAANTFGKPIQVDHGETQGRVDVLMLADNSALVCWLSGNAAEGAIKVRRVKADGSVGPPAVIANIDISRSSGFPRMARLGNQVYVAWTEFGKPSKVRMAVVEIPT
jgi:hypothetical protein